MSDKSSQENVMQYHSTDDGYCRAYYRHNGRLLCLQKDRGPVYELLECTPEGEPSHPIDHSRYRFELPTCGTETGAEICDWVAEQGVGLAA